MTRNNANDAGFTFVELIVVLGIGVILFGITTITLFRFQRSVKITTSVETVISDIKKQQYKTMIGATEGRAVSDYYGIYFQPGQYTLFHGPTFIGEDPANFTIALEGVSVSTTLPDDTLIFTKGNGEIVNFAAGANTITLTSSDGGDTKTMSLNRYGTLVALD